MKKVIFLNAGHSEKDPGSLIPRNRYQHEAKLNIAIRFFLISELESQGFIVKSVPDNRNLKESIAWVNERAFKIDDGLALSVHNNCCGGEGAETLYYKYNRKSKKIAENLINEFCKETGLKNRGAKSDSTTRFGMLGWIRKTNIWAALIECGFVDNENDMDFIFNNLDRVARGIARGVCKIYGIDYKEKKEPPQGREEIKKKIIELLEKL